MYKLLPSQCSVIVELDITTASFWRQRIIMLSRRYNTTDIILLSIMMTFLMVVVIVGNMLVIIAIATDHTLTNKQNWFIASLAFADLSLGVVIMPFSLAKEVSHICWQADWRKIDWQTDWLKDRLFDRQIDWQTDWLTDRLIDRQTDWQTDWLIDFDCGSTLPLNRHCGHTALNWTLCIYFIRSIFLIFIVTILYLSYIRAELTDGVLYCFHLDRRLIITIIDCIILYIDIVTCIGIVISQQIHNHLRSLIRYAIFACNPTGKNVYSGYICAMCEWNFYKTGPRKLKT